MTVALQCVAVFYSILQYVAACCSVLQCVAVCCSVLHYDCCVVVCRSAHTWSSIRALRLVDVNYNLCCSVL